MDEVGWPTHMLLFFLGFTLLALIGAVEQLTRRRGIVIGLPIAELVEDYAVTIDNPRGVDVEPHLYDVGRVEWLTDTRLLLFPAHGEVHMHAQVGSHSRSSATSFMCIGDLRIDARPGALHFRTRVILRVVPLLGALLFVFGPYVPEPWGMDWPLPGQDKYPLLVTLWPLVLFGSMFAYAAVRARRDVVSAHHAVTAAFMSAPADD